MHVIQVYQDHHQHCCTAQNRRRRVKVWGFVAWKITAFMWRRFLEKQGSGWCTENAFTWPIHQRTQPKHVMKVYQDHHQHCCTAQNRRRRVKVWVVSLGRSQRLCGDGSSKIRGSGLYTENAFTWHIHQRTQLRHIIKVYQDHH